MRWTPDEYASYQQREVNRKRQASVMEHGPVHEPLETPPLEEAHPKRVLVRVTSFRKRLLDEDNLCEKFHVDCLRYSGLIEGDDPQRTKIEVRQVKSKTEYIEIEIEEII